MNTQQQKRLMLNIFGSMMMGGHFRNPYKMTGILKGIYLLLSKSANLTTQECDNCLLYFFQEYAKGCSNPISDYDIRTIMIPSVKNYTEPDHLTALSLFMTAQ